jgi:hypothetical protein
MFRIFASYLLLNVLIMEQVAGITVERTSRGRPHFVRIDLRKHADFIPLLEESKNDPK